MGPGGDTQTVTFWPLASARPTSHQDVADPYSVGTLKLAAGAAGLEIDGKRLRLAGQTSLLQDDSTLGGPRVLRAPLQIDGAVRVRGRNEAAGNGLTLTDVSGAGSITLVTGSLRIGHASYSGATTVSGGTLQIGGWTTVNPLREFLAGSTQGQGDYLVRPASPSPATLEGTGTIGLASGKSIVVDAGGTLAPGYNGLPNVATTLAVNGNVRFGDGGHYRVWSAGAEATSLLDVNGRLDLLGRNDVMDFTGLFQQSGTVVVAEYESRLGEFDLLRTVFTGGRGGETASISYTSESGEGPGKVLVTVTVPEPALCATAGGASVAFLLRRRRSARQAVKRRG
jgi:autotransporter-associated beta strand protein